MAINVNDNFKINAGKPIDVKYLNTGNTAYTSVCAVKTAITIPERNLGLTVLVSTGGTNVEYWWKNGVQNTDLTEKKYDSILPQSDYVTGATNLGYFSGSSQVQILEISTGIGMGANYSAYTGNYCSLYNYYFRGTDGAIHIGAPPSDEIERRGYVKNEYPVKSWVWNESGGTNPNLLGWIFVDGNIKNCLTGAFTIACPYGTPTHTETAYTPSTAYPSLSYADIDNVYGAFTGATITIGARPYACFDHNNLHFRTVISDTPNLLAVRDDETFIHISGSTGNQLLTASNGLNKILQDVRLGGRLISGATVINLSGSSSLTFTDSRVTPTGVLYGADYSASFTPRSLVDRGYVDNKVLNPLGGERIFKTICQAHLFTVNDVIGWSGSTYNKAIANGSYDGEVLGIVTKNISASCFELTQAGYVSGLTPTLVMNCTYFLSATVPGLLTYVEPSTPNYLSKSVLIATSSSSGWVLPYAAYVISSGITEGGPLIKSVCIPGTTYTVKNTDYYIGACNNSWVILPPTPKVGMVVVVSDVGVMPDVASVADPIIIAGTIIGGAPSACIDTAYGSLTFINTGTCVTPRWSVIGFAPAP